MSALKKILDELMTVEVCGETISLRHPPYQVKVRVRKLLEDANVSEEGERKASVIQDLMGGILVTSLMATVVDQELTEEDWSRLISRSNENPDEYPGLIDLCNQAVKLCGLSINLIPTDEEIGESSDVTDEVDKAIGVDPTL